MAANSSSLTGALKQLEDTISLYLVQKAPALPKEWKDLIVKFAPWLTLIFVILSLPAVLVLFGISTIALPFSFLAGPYAPAGISAALIFLVAIIVLEALAIPGLFKRQRQAWNYLYWAALLGAVENIITFNLGGLIIGTLLSLYLLFQVREYYK